jgi:hypothetical protein
MLPSIRIEGAILSADILGKLGTGDVSGQRPADFGCKDATGLKEDLLQAWTSAQAYYRAFRAKVDRLPESSPATTETRNLWIIPLLGLLGYSELEFQQSADVVGDKPFRFSHRLRSHGGFVVHAVGARDSLDRKVKGKRTGADDSGRLRESTPSLSPIFAPSSSGSASPHGLVQEYLNLTEHLYALVTNGRILRLLRDSTRLVKLSYVEFDLDRMFEEELFADFSALFRLLHVTRLPKSPDTSAQSLLERYHQDALDAGSRIREHLSAAVRQAMQDLGSGFLLQNPDLQEAAASKTLQPVDFHRTILRLVYRLLFLMTAEERRLLFPHDADPRLRSIYEQHYSMARLRRLAERRHLVEPAKHDLWVSLLSTFSLFEVENAGAPLGLTALCGHLFSADALGVLRTSRLDNATFLSALTRLSVFREEKSGQLIRVNYGAMETEEFGSVYESLLELHPVFLDGTPPRFGFKQAAGNERKTTGSYYTPSSLVECLLDSALDPVVEERLRRWKDLGYQSARAALLALNVCDPACGSGHFLIAAAQRIARKLATLDSPDSEPSPDQLRHSLREVISHCLYGVDVNPMAVELCKVTLWLEATEPGKPLSFLDHHIQCGNSLLGATPRVLADGVPDDAFKPLTGDDKDFCANAKKQNKLERKIAGHGELFGREDAPAPLQELPAAMLEVETMSDDTAAALHRKEQRYADLLHSALYENAHFLADAWCAAFVWKKCSPADGGLDYAITNDVLRKIERNPHDCAPWMRGEIEKLRHSYQFFHWHLAFPEVFPLPAKGQHPVNAHAGWNGGFDVMLGNPPWETIKLLDKEWFANKRPEIVDAPNAAARSKLINELELKDPPLYQEYTLANRLAAGCASLVSGSGTYPLCSSGDLNTFALFAELTRNLVSTTELGLYYRPESSPTIHINNSFKRYWTARH